MLGGFALLLAFQILGELVVRLTGLPIPGPVVGMVFFLGWLSWRRPVEGSASVRGAEVLVRYLPLMFVPTTVGVVVYGPQIAAQWLPAAVASFGTWLLTFVLVAWVATWLRPRGGRPSRRAGAGAA